MRNNPFHIAALGSSAGGLKALVEFFSQIKEDNRITYIVTRHSARNGNGQLDNILSRLTSLEVVKIVNGMEILPNKIYISPQSHYVSVENGKFHLCYRDDSEIINRTIDHVFYSMSEELKERAIAIVLSGTGKDGTLGFQAIARNNGLTITQAPETAEFDGMPVNTMLFSDPKYIVPPSEMRSVIEKAISNHKFRPQ
jgi:two-component system CheB/CheR fusion protein